MRNLILLTLLHLRVRLSRTLILEAGIPPEHCRAPRWHEFAVGPALEQDWFVAGPFAVAKSGDGLGAFVFKSREQ